MRTQNKRHFTTIFLEEIWEFLRSVNSKAVKKIFYNIEWAEQTHDPRLFKKLTEQIWEFRTRYGHLQYRLLAFWDKRNPSETLVVATHGIIKKTDKMPIREIDKAEKLRSIYLGENIK